MMLGLEVLENDNVDADCVLIERVPNNTFRSIFDRLLTLRTSRSQKDSILFKGEGSRKIKISASRTCAEALVA